MTQLTHYPIIFIMQAIYEQILLQQNKSGLSNQEIYQLSSKIKNSLSMLQNCESEKEKSVHRKLLSSYLTIISKTSAQLKQARQRYQRIDKQALVDKRCEQLSASLKWFRNQAFSLNTQIKKLGSNILVVKKSNDLLMWSLQGLKNQLIKRETVTKLQKRSYMNQTVFLSEPPQTQLLFPAKDNFMTCDQLTTDRKSDIKTGRLAVRSKNKKVKETQEYFSEADYQSIKKQL